MDIRLFSGPKAFGPQWEEWLEYAWHLMRNYINLDDIIKVCAETENRLYRRQGGRNASFPLCNTGNRPMLEKMLANLTVVLPCLKNGGDEDVFFALGDWVYWEVLRRGEVLRQDKWSNQLIEGGSEEDVLGFVGRSGSFDAARLLIVLLQMKKIPARLVLVFAGNYHIRAGVEAEIDRRWIFFDLKYNKFYPAPNTDAMNIMELLRDNCEFRDCQAGIVAYPVKPAVSASAGSVTEVKKNSSGSKQKKQDETEAVLVKSPEGLVEYNPEKAWRDRLTMNGRKVVSHEDLEPYRGWRKLHGEAALINKDYMRTLLYSLKISISDKDI